MNKDLIQMALVLLQDYLSSYPEHDQGDLRVWEAAQLLEKELLSDL